MAENIAGTITINEENVLSSPENLQNISMLSFDENNVYQLKYIDLIKQISNSKNIEKGSNHIFNDPNNEAETSYSAVFGEGNKTTNEYQFVLGKYNDINNLENYIFIIGYGENDNFRKNILLIDKEGQIHCKDVFFGEENKQLSQLPTILFGEDDPSEDMGKVGDIYCKIIKENL